MWLTHLYARKSSVGAALFGAALQPKCGAARCDGVRCCSAAVPFCGIALHYTYGIFFAKPWLGDPTDDCHSFQPLYPG
jgi:hypothetical protein